MIEINLLPDEFKKRKRAAPKIGVKNINLEKIPLIKIAIITVSVVVIIQLIVSGMGLLGNAILSSLEKNYKEILPQKEQAQQLKAQISRMSKKVVSIDELMVKRSSWAKRLNDLSDSMTPGVWLTQLEYDEKLTEKPKSSAAAVKGKNGAEGKPVMEKVLERYLIISGSASNTGEEGTALVGRFIKNLKENPAFYSDFSDIELGAIKREQVSGQEIMTFKITCLFKIK